MFRNSLAAVAALALLASTMPASVTTAGELKANQKKQGLLLPAVQKVREAAARNTRTTRGALKGNKSVTVGGNTTENRSKVVVPPGSVRFITGPAQ